MAKLNKLGINGKLWHLIDGLHINTESATAVNCAQWFSIGFDSNKTHPSVKTDLYEKDNIHRFLWLQIIEPAEQWPKNPDYISAFYSKAYSKLPTDDKFWYMWKYAWFAENTQWNW